jgi:hypothetical protein
MRKGSGLRSENFENMHSVIAPKPPKPGFGSFGAIDLGGCSDYPHLRMSDDGSVGWVRAQEFGKYAG